MGQHTTDGTTVAELPAVVVAKALPSLHSCSKKLKPAKKYDHLM
jgi:hypothetical protein